MATYIKGKGEKSLLLATASGLNVHNPEFPLGPHVGSYHNKLFKRSLLLTGLPIVLFVDATKLDAPFRRNHCFSVCDSELLWHDVCQKIPLALCVGSANEDSRKSLIERIGSFGFTFIDPLEATTDYQCVPLLVRNQLFNDVFPSPAIYKGCEA